MNLRVILFSLATVALFGVHSRAESKDTLRGIVVDEAGKPVAGAEVSVKSWPRSQEVKSDGTGAFQVSLPQSRGRVFVTIVASGGNGRLGVVSMMHEIKKPEPIKIVLKPSRTLDVRVVDGAGKPVEGAEVHFRTGWFQIAHGRTDNDGRWTEKIPADMNDWHIYALKSKVGFDYDEVQVGRSSTDPVRPLPDRFNLTLDGARSPLHVKTVDKNGRPLAGVKVGPWLIQKPGHSTQLNGVTDAFVKTDANGLAVLDWLPALKEGTHPFQIVCSADDYEAQEHAILVPDDKPVDEISITLLPYEQLSGRVTTADGKPAVDVTVAVTGNGASHNGFRGESKTDADGRYTFKANTDQAYIITATKGDLAAPYKSGLILRAGKPVTNADLVLGQGTHLKGAVTVGKDHKPLPDVYVYATIDKGRIPDELLKAGDRFYRAMTMQFPVQTDKQGRFDFLLGPGDYTLQGPTRTENVKLTIPSVNPPIEVVHDFAMPRALNGPFTATVVDAAGKPLAGAVFEGAYQSNLAYFPQTTADARGTLNAQRSLDPLVLVAHSADRTLGGIVRIDADATEARIVAKPTATASGRLVDHDGKAIAGRKLDYGIMVHNGPTKNSSFSWHFGGKTTSDATGHFSLSGLIVGESYDVYSNDLLGMRIYRVQAKVQPTDSQPIALGDAVMDSRPPKPYVPPTPAERTRDSFAARKEKTPREKIDYTLVEAKREYTRPLLLLGDSKDPACVDLFRLFNEQEGEQNAKVKTPADLRWEFELASLDSTQANVKALAKDLGISLADGEPRRLVILADNGKAGAAYELKLGTDKKLDAKALAAFLLEQKLPTRDAEKMLADGLAKAKAENKRVFLIMSASWCGPCRMLARYLVAHKAELAPHYVFVKLDVSRDMHGDELKKRYEGKDAQNGIPWFLILDGAGKPMITSNAKEAEDYGSTNIGFPSSKSAIDHFMTMLKQTAPGLSQETLAALRKGLETK